MPDVATHEDTNQLADFFLEREEGYLVDLGPPLSPHFHRYFVRWNAMWWRMTEEEWTAVHAVKQLPEDALFHDAMVRWLKENFGA